MTPYQNWLLPLIRLIPGRSLPGFGVVIGRLDSGARAGHRPGSPSETASTQFRGSALSGVPARSVNPRNGDVSINVQILTIFCRCPPLVQTSRGVSAPQVACRLLLRKHVVVHFQIPLVRNFPAHHRQSLDLSWERYPLKQIEFDMILSGYRVGSLAGPGAAS